MKRVIFLISFLVSLLVIKNLVFSIYSLWNKQDLFTQAQKELKEEQAEQKKLESQLSKANDREFIEEQARNRLFMVKPGENQVVLAKPAESKRFPQEERTVPYWKQWLQLFF